MLRRIIECHLRQMLYIFRRMNEFNIHYVPRLENGKANELAQQASGYNVSKGRFSVNKKPMLEVVELDHSDANASNRDSTESLDRRSLIVLYIHSLSQNVDRKV